MSITRQYRDGKSDHKCPVSPEALEKRKISAVVGLRKCKPFKGKSPDEIKTLMPTMTRIGKDFVYKGKTTSGYWIVVKINTDSYSNAEFEREVEIGFKEVNKVRRVCPNFMYTYGVFSCPLPTVSGNHYIPCDGEGNFKYLALEYVQGKSLGEELLSLTEKELARIYLQMMYALHVAKEMIGFTHGDLHLGNVLLDRTPRRVKYKTPNGVVVLPSRITPVFIDYGKSSTNSNKRRLPEYYDIQMFTDSIFNTVRRWYQRTSKTLGITIPDLLEDPKYVSYRNVVRSIFHLFSGFLKDKSEGKMVSLLTSDSPLVVEKDATYIDLANNLRAIYGIGRKH